MTNEQVHEEVIVWLRAVLGIVVIKDRQQAGRPAMPYGMLDLANWGPMDDHPILDTYVDLDEDDVEVTPRINVEWTFLFYVYGEQGDNLIRKLQAAFHLTQMAEPLSRLGLVLHEVSRANSVPELVGEVWEPRTQVNLTVRGISDDAFPTPVIVDANYTAERA